MTKTLEIDTGRLILKACTREDLLKIYRGDIKKMNTASGWPLKDLKEALPHFLNDLMDDPGSIGWNVWLVILKEDGMIIGDAGFKGKPDGSGIVEIGYSIDPDHRSMGFAREAVSALTANAFSTGEVNKIQAECSEENDASITVLRSTGFKNIGVEDGMIKWKLTLPQQ